MSGDGTFFSPEELLYRCVRCGREVVGRGGYVTYNECVGCDSGPTMCRCRPLWEVRSSIRIGLKMVEPQQENR